MHKLKSIVFAAGVMLFVLAVAMGILSVQDYLGILPADSYEDKGVHTFRPYQVSITGIRMRKATGSR